MEVETDLRAEALEHREALELGGFPFWTGRLGSWEAAVSRTGVGYANAAAATALGIQRFRPAVVVNQGTAGAHREDLRTGDIVVAESCVPIHSTSMPPRGPGEGSDPFSWQPKGITAGNSRGEALDLPADRDWTGRLLSAPWGGRKLVGRLGSGDVFNREHDRIRWLRARLGEDCEDMESFASCFICHRMGVPWAGARIISNNELTGEPYRRETGEELQRFLLEVLKTGR